MCRRERCPTDTHFMQNTERVVRRDGEIGGWSTWTRGVAHRDCSDKQRRKRMVNIETCQTSCKWQVQSACARGKCRRASGLMNNMLIEETTCEHKAFVKIGISAKCGSCALVIYSRFVFFCPWLACEGELLHQCLIIVIINS